MKIACRDVEGGLKLKQEFENFGSKRNLLRKI